MSHRSTLYYSLSWLTRLLIVPIIVLSVTCSCIEEEKFSDNAYGTFKALWKILDEHYCFFSEKNIDWNAIREKYSRQVNEGMNYQQLFEVLTNMIGELRDGHVNLYTSFDMGRNWSWFEDYPINFSDTLYNKYMGKDYKIAAGLRYKTLDDNIGYIYYGSFNDSFGEGNLDEVLMELAPTRALILDIRNNAGGLLTNAEKLAARFTNKEVLVGYMRHKTGRGHNDFSSLKEQHIKPSKGVRWQKQVLLLTNRSVFSAANEFVKYMKCFPQVIIIGDQTGGGAGLPFSSELPNGWGVRFSACPMYDVNKQCTEQGIAPDHFVSLTQEDFLKDKDSIIEYARNLVP